MAAADQLQGPWPFRTARRAECDECDPGRRRVRTLVQNRQASMAEQLSLPRLPARRRLSWLIVSGIRLLCWRELEPVPGFLGGMLKVQGCFGGAHCLSSVRVCACCPGNSRGS